MMKVFWVVLVLSLALSCTSRGIKPPAGTVPFTAEGTFTGCWSVTGGLKTDTFISLFSPPLAGALLAPDPANTLLLPLPPDPTPNVISQNPNSLLIQMGDFAQISRAQLCNDFNTVPFPGTLFIPQPEQQRFAGFYGGSMKVDGYQTLLPECVPPGVPGIVCDPTKATITLTSIDVTVSENIISGYLTPAPAAAAGALFSISNVPCKPIVYNFPVTNPNAISINAKVLDQYGFVVDPLTLTTQGDTLASGWFSKINGENLFYYYSATVLAGNRIPGQVFAVSAARCVVGGALRIVGGVSTSNAAIPWPNPLDLGTVIIRDTLLGTLIGTGVPTVQVSTIPTGSFVLDIPVVTCPRTVFISWNPPAGLTLPATSVTTLSVTPNIR